MLQKKDEPRMLTQLVERNLSHEVCIQEGIKIYEQFPEAKAKKAAKKGCLAIGVRVGFP
jgi:hypothetical protein